MYKDHEHIGQSEPVFRIHEMFGTGRILGSSSHEKKIIDLFSKNGFAIVKGGAFNATNPLELTYPLEFLVDRYRRDQQIARSVGIAMPPSYDPKTVLQSSEPVVAKIPAADRGTFKYLLETDEQKVKFISWALLFDNLPDFASDIPAPEAAINRVFQTIREGNFSDPLIPNQRFLDSWLFEKYIETPGDFHTSLRIVSDAFGNVHYGQVARSKESKGRVLLPVPQIELDPLAEISYQNPNPKAKTPLTMLLEHPDSPFYIAPKQFVSNIVAGGSAIFLDGKMVTDPNDRQVLEALGINPDEPHIPKSLTIVSGKIGQSFRRHAIYNGSDYMLQDDGQSLLLEINKKPILLPQALGLPESTDGFACEIELYRRLLRNVPFAFAK